MFEDLQNLPGDPILSIMAAFRADPASNKLDLSAGVYRDSAGLTPVMAAVAEAEQKVLAEQLSKAYIGLAGNALFNTTIQSLMLGAEHAVVRAERVLTLQTPGGSGGLRVAAEFFKRIDPDVRLWMSDPSWPNHEPLISSAGIELLSYPYFDAESGGVKFDAMMEALGEARRGDLLLLHGCCHNPSGADLSAAEWDRVVEFCREEGLIPFVDIAYQGFGDSADQDAYGLRTLAESVPEMVFVGSCSKNFGLYKERTGSVSVIGRSRDETETAFSHMLRIVRRIYSMPPDHGAAIAGTILSDPALEHVWAEELNEYRARMKSLRAQLAEALTSSMPGESFDFLTRQKGMFSILPVLPEQVTRLREEHHVYMLASGRINVAGLQEASIDRLAAAIAATTGR